MKPQDELVLKLITTLQEVDLVYKLLNIEQDRTFLNFLLKYYDKLENDVQQLMNLPSIGACREILMSQDICIN
jgi:hypothetical protein